MTITCFFGGDLSIFPESPGSSLYLLAMGASVARELYCGEDCRGPFSGKRSLSTLLGDLSYVYSLDMYVHLMRVATLHPRHDQQAHGPFLSHCTEHPRLPARARFMSPPRCASAGPAVPENEGYLCASGSHDDSRKWSISGEKYVTPGVLFRRVWRGSCDVAAAVCSAGDRSCLRLIFSRSGSLRAVHVSVCPYG